MLRTHWHIAAAGAGLVASALALLWRALGHGVAAPVPKIETIRRGIEAGQNVDPADIRTLLDM